MKPVEILRDMQKFPNKHFGQNFLVDEKVLTDIITAAKLEKDDTVVEIGPGLGVLTQALLPVTKRVIAIEADRDLATHLREKNHQGLTVVTGDALRVEWEATIKGDYKIVANIPYSITSPLLRKIFSLAHKPSLVVLLIQKEVAERLSAVPGNNDRGYLTMILEANATVKIIRTVKPGSFRPMPSVDSAIVAITPFEQSQAFTLYWPAIEAGFHHKRQILANTLSTDLRLPKPAVAAALARAEIKPMARPAELNFTDWQRLSQGIQALTEAKA